MSDCIPLPQSKSSNDIVSLSMINTGSLSCDRNWIIDPCPGPGQSERIDIPVFAFLIERKGKNYLFDLGIRPDLHVRNYSEFIPTSISPLPASLPADISRGELALEEIFISHHHWDHMGNPCLLPKGSKIVMGKGSIDELRGISNPMGQGEQWLSYCDFHEIDFELDRNTQAVGEFERGIDWFGDGSLWIIDCPGHCAGNIVALARVTTSPDTYVLLGGDCCHDQTLYEYKTPCSSYSIAYYTGANGDRSSLHEDHQVAKDNMERLNKMSKRDDVMVIIAHEREALGVIPLLEEGEENRGVLRNWKKNGWKQAKTRKSK